MKFKKILILLLILLFIIPLKPCYASEDTLNLYSDAAILLDSASGLILYSKNADKKMYPASTTKILTSIIAIENCNPNDIVTVSKSAISSIPPGYSSCYLSEGEQISVRDLLTVFLIHSANDAGYVLAEHISGSIQNFAELMNKKATEIGCKNSNFMNPSGIHDSNHYSTAYDLCLIAQYCMKNSAFRNFVSMPSCTIGATNKFGIRKYQNTNDLLNPSSKYYLEDCIGIKTGYTSEAKNCLICCFKKNGLELISVVLSASTTENGDSARNVDSRTLHDYGFSNYSLKDVAKKGDVIKNIEIENASKDSKNLDLILENDIQMLLPNSLEYPQCDISLNENIVAPINENDVMGTITYSIDNVSHTENIIASHFVDVKKDYTIYIILVFIFIIFSILINILFIKKRKKKSKNK